MKHIKYLIKGLLFFVIILSPFYFGYWLNPDKGPAISGLIYVSIVILAGAYLIGIIIDKEL